MIKKIGVDEKTKTPAYLNTETGLVSFGCGIIPDVILEGTSVTEELMVKYAREKENK